MHASIGETLGSAAGVVSPRHRRWRRLLEGLRLDPDVLAHPIPAPSDRDFMICGSPRSGTTLLAAMLWQPPDVVTVSEPWDGLRLAPADLFASLRREIADTGALRRGRLDVDRLVADGVISWARDGEITARPPTRPGYLLGVKWPAFWRYIPMLPDTKFLVCVRHPVDVITSYRNHGGALRRGFDYECAFNRRMNAFLRSATRDEYQRRVLLYEYINSRILPWLEYPNVYVVHYELWFSEPDRMRDEIGAFLGVELGPGHAVIRRSQREGEASPRERRLIDRHCSVAGALGYVLG